MFRVSSTLLAILFLSLNGVSFGQTKTSEREISYAASDDDSKSSCKAKAIKKLRETTLDEVGVYVQSETLIKTIESGGNFSSDYIENIKTSSAALVTIKVLEDSWDGRTYWMKASVSVDTAKVINLKKLISVTPEPEITYAAKLIIDDWKYVGIGHDIGFNNNKKYYEVCISILANQSELARIEKVRYYQLHDSVGEGGAEGKIFSDTNDLETNFNSCYTLWGSYPIRAVIYYKEGKIKSLDVKWK